MNVRAVKAGSLEERQRCLYEDRITEATAQSVKMAYARGVQRSVTVILESFGQIALLYAGALEVLHGHMTAGELSAFFLQANQVMSSTQDLLALYSQFQAAIGATRRVFQLIDLSPGLQDSGTCLEPIQGRIELCNVHLQYGDTRHALKNVSLCFEPSTVTALVGSSGSGKSSIASLVLRLYDPTQGVLKLDGRPLQQWMLSWLHSHIAIVAQEPMLFSCSIRDNLAYGCNIPPTITQIEAAARTANAHDFIMLLPDGYDTMVGERGCCLSGGQRQRLAIAVAVLRDPKVLVLDEATSALDSVSESLVRAALARLMPGRTSIVIAHRLSTIREADSIVVLHHGSVLEQGSHHELLALPQGRYKALLAAQTAAEPIGDPGKHDSEDHCPTR
eukprot:TRINITY_DN5029_c0_g1_i2.p1 TRINITY_DN5029_c0_g1~~TRINITY_DN5029_c0_g1_i2.p1  ORF type:complete len:390 (-),score=104.32 TRINITY_DN5029_c0_g1_i2:582-1751(-)